MLFKASLVSVPERMATAAVNVSSCQLIHMRLGAVMLGIVITIPRKECDKFRQNGNEKYSELLRLIHDTN